MTSNQTRKLHKMSRWSQPGSDDHHPADGAYQPNLPIPFIEDSMIDKLLDMMKIYQENSFPYTLFPDEGKAEYNSNGFISGIGAAAGFSMPKDTGAKTPGYSNPAPQENFQRPPPPYR